MQANPLSSTSSDPSGSLHSPIKPWKLKICPVKPFHDVPFLLSSLPSATLYTLRERVAKVLRRYGPVEDDHILFFVSSDGMKCALVEDGPISDFMQDGEKVEVRLDEALASQNNGHMDQAQTLGKRAASEDDDILLEANRIAQKIKTEIGSKKGRKYEDAIVEPEWPEPPPSLSIMPVGSPSLLLPPPMTSTGAAAAAIQAFEDKKRSLRMNGNVKGGAESSSTSSSSSESDSSSSSESGSDSSDSSSDGDDKDASSSSSSSSSDSSSKDSSSSSEDSNSPSSSDSDDENDESSSAKTSLATTTSLSYPQTNVPPGKGLARTQRKNQLRRGVRRKEMQKEREQLFLEAKDRAEKRERGERVDEEAIEQAWMMDTKGSKPIVHNGLGKQRFGVVSRDSELVLPPGGGSFGIPEKSKAKKGKSDQESLAPFDIDKGPVSVDLPEQPSRENRGSKDKVVKRQKAVGFDTSSSREPPPPSMRSMPVPAGIRLTSVDCDDCYNEIDEHGNLIMYDEVEGEDEEEVNPGYAAFQARAKEALRLAKEEEERKELVLGCEDELQYWEGSVDYDDVFVDQNDGELAEAYQSFPVEVDDGLSAPIDEKQVDHDEQQDRIDLNVDGVEAAQTVFPDMPISFGKKQDWDGNEPLTMKKATSIPRREDDLDYGEPEDAVIRPASVHQDIKKLRSVLENELAKREEETQKKDKVYEAREAALASLKTRRRVANH